MWQKVPNTLEQLGIASEVQWRGIDWSRLKVTKLRTVELSRSSHENKLGNWNLLTRSSVDIDLVVWPGDSLDGSRLSDAST